MSSRLPGSPISRSAADRCDPVTTVWPGRLTIQGQSTGFADANRHCGNTIDRADTDRADTDRADTVGCRAGRRPALRRGRRVPAISDSARRPHATVMAPAPSTERFVGLRARILADCRRYRPWAIHDPETIVRRFGLIPKIILKLVSQ